MRLYSTANERGLHCNSLWCCLAANCSRNGCVHQVFCYKKNCPTCSSCPSKIANVIY
ncbi:MAG: hypothetical protein LBP59_09185 [Planctomycetaceae bacterium]|nr:hypothetical protein [Planctomycetaceae bacterium]